MIEAIYRHGFRSFVWLFFHPPFRRQPLCGGFFTHYWRLLRGRCLYCGDAKCID
jgi:hypothetical protein